MIKKLRVTVDGITYEVLVEMDEDDNAASNAVPAATPVAPALLSPSPASVPPSTAPATSAAGPGDVPSPLAGRVTAVNVQLGQDVKEGDHLLTLEAMKMNTFVLAPRAGKVKDVKVVVGSTVDEGQTLVALE